MSYKDMKFDVQASLEADQRAADQIAGPKFKRDERYWRPALDASGNGMATIRFLPGAEKEDPPFVEIISFGFKWPTTNRWYIENSPATIRLPDPVSVLNSTDWATDDEGKARAKIRRRKVQYISNIYVVKHDARKEDEGKVFLFKYGKKIYEKIYDKLKPIDDQVTAYTPFNPWTGANFRLRVAKVDGFPNYDKSEFLAQAALSPDDNTIASIMAGIYPLEAEVAPDKFKSYAELEEKLKAVMGAGIAPAVRQPLADHVRAPSATGPAPAAPWEDSGDDEEGISFLKSLRENHA